MPPSSKTRAARATKATSGSAKVAPRTIDEYFASLNGAQRDALQAMRRAIGSLVPQAEECISYGVAAFRLNGKVLVGLGATSKHCAFYPMSGSTIAAFGQRLAGFETTKGCIKFQPDEPLPLALVKALTKSRLADLKRGAGGAE